MRITNWLVSYSATSVANVQVGYEFGHFVQRLLPVVEREDHVARSGRNAAPLQRLAQLRLEHRRELIGRHADALHAKIKNNTVVECIST